MKPSYELLVHYADGVDPLRVAHTLTAEWQRSGRPKLLYFPRSGEGIEPTEEFLTGSLKFLQDGESCALRLRTKRARNQVDAAELYFSNPEWKYSKALNFVAITFIHELIDSAHPGYSCQTLANLLGALTTAGPAETGYVEAYEVLHAPPIEEARRKVIETPGGFVHWITFLPPTVVRNGVSTELHVLRELKGGGLIVTTGEEPPVDRERHIRKLLALAKWAEHPGGQGYVH